MRYAAAPLHVMPAESAAAWDELVGTAAGATFCHLFGWKQIFEDVLGHACRFSAAVDDEGHCHGLLPLVRVRSRLFGHYLVSMPFLNYGGAIGTDAAQQMLNDWAARETARTGANLLELRSRHVSPAAAGLQDAQRKITVVLDLPETADVLWHHAFRPKLRSQIRRAQKEGMEVRFGSSELGSFYDVYAENMRDLGTPALAYRFFASLPAVFEGRVQFGTVYFRDVAVAAGAGFYSGGEYEMTWASSRRRYNRLAPNMLLYWSAMEEAIRRGATQFNFGRCTPGGGTHRFKQQWGGTDIRLPWLQAGKRSGRGTPDPQQSGFRAAVACWKRLPLPIASTAGPPIARLLP